MSVVEDKEQRRRLNYLDDCSLCYQSYTDNESVFEGKDSQGLHQEMLETIFPSESMTNHSASTLFLLESQHGFGAKKRAYQEEGPSLHKSIHHKYLSSLGVKADGSQCRTKINFEAYRIYIVAQLS
jgi:hypothetical protein